MVTPSEPAFLSCPRFDGARAGYVFTNGVLGTGYYHEVTELPAVPGMLVVLDATRPVVPWVRADVRRRHFVVDRTVLKVYGARGKTHKRTVELKGATLLRSAKDGSAPQGTLELHVTTRGIFWTGREILLIAPTSNADYLVAALARACPPQAAIAGSIESRTPVILTPSSSAANSSQSMARSRLRRAMRCAMLSKHQRAVAVTARSHVTESGGGQGGGGGGGSGGGGNGGGGSGGGLRRLSESAPRTSALRSLVGRMVTKRGTRRAVIRKRGDEWSSGALQALKRVPKPPSTTQLLIEVLEQETHLIFRPLSAAGRRLSAECFTRHAYRKGQVVIKQGEEGDKVYVVESGGYAAFLEQGSSEAVGR